MTLYRWVGGSASWATPSSWAPDGAPNGSYPQDGDYAEIAAPGTYTIELSGIAVNGLVVSNPAVTLRASNAVQNGTTLPGIATGQLELAGTLDVTDSETFTQYMRIFLGGDPSVPVAIVAEATLTLGLYDFLQINGGMRAMFTGGTIVTPASINNAGTLVVDAAEFINSGYISTVQGAITTLGSPTTTLLVNTGHIVGDGTLDVLNDISGTGEIGVHGHGVAELHGSPGDQAFSIDQGGLLKLDQFGGSHVTGIAPGGTIELVGVAATISLQGTVLAVGSAGQALGEFVIPSYFGFYAATTDGDGNTFITSATAPVYDWAGGSGAWESAANWLAGGTADGNAPGIGAAVDAIAAIGGTASETVTIGAAQLRRLDLTDPAAVLRLSGAVTAGEVDNSGEIDVLSGALRVGLLAYGNLGTALVNAGLITIAGGATLGVDNTAFVNAGSIAIAAGGVLDQSGGLSGAVANHGIISLAAGAQLRLGGIATAALGNIQNDGGTITIAALANTGATLSTAAFGAAELGTVTGGTLDARGGPALVLKPSHSLYEPSLQDVTLLGRLALGGANMALNPVLGAAATIELGETRYDGAQGPSYYGGWLEIQNAVNAPFAIDGTIDVTAQHAWVSLTVVPYLSTIFPNTIGYTPPMSGVSSLLLGPSSVVDATGDGRLGIQASTLALQGVVMGGGSPTSGLQFSSGATGYDPGSSFLNSGTISMQGGGTLGIGLTLAGPEYAGFVQFHGGITNAGTIAIGAGSTAFSYDVGLRNTGAIIDDGGTLTLRNGLFGTGTLVLANGALAGIGGDHGGQGFRFAGTGNLLRLESNGAGNTVTEFDTGDTIELAGMAASIAFADGTLTATGTSGVVASFVMPDQPAGALFQAAADGQGNTIITELAGAAPCFAAGTRIATPRGEVAVEDLRPGERVMLAGGGSAEVVWLGHRRIDCRRHARPWDVLPVRVQAGAFAPGVPARDLRLSPDHAVFVGGVLIPIRYLLNGATVAQEDAAEVTYYHVELPAHGVILAEGLAAESYLDSGNRGAFGNGDGAVELHPDFARGVWQRQGCAPLRLAGPEVAEARRRLLARAPALGHPAADAAGLRVLVDGAAAETRREGLRWRVRLPQGARRLHLVSRVWVPAHMRPDETDMRVLGVAVAGITFDGAPAGLDDTRLSSGWHAAEPDLRWTDGEASIAVGGAREIGFGLAATGRYWVRPGAREAVRRLAQ